MQVNDNGECECPCCPCPPHDEPCATTTTTTAGPTTTTTLAPANCDNFFVGSWDANISYSLNSVVCHDCGNGLESYRWSDGANNSVVGGQSPCNDASWVRANNFNNSNYDTCCCSVCSGYNAISYPQERYSGEYNSSSRCSNWQLVSTSVYPATSGFTANMVIAWAAGIFDSWISSNGYNECCYCYGVDKISTSFTGTTYEIYACPTGNDGCPTADCTSDGTSGGPVEAWNNETTYNATSGTDAVVCYNGLAYRCVQTHNLGAEASGAVTPGTDTNYWVRVSSYDDCCTSTTTTAGP